LLEKGRLSSPHGHGPVFMIGLWSASVNAGRLAGSGTRHASCEGRSSLASHSPRSVQHCGSAARRDSMKKVRAWWLPPSPRPALRQLHPLVRPLVASDSSWPHVISAS
jgi:hypothetical protein